MKYLLFISKEIGPRTIKALDELSNTIYRKTEYQKNYKQSDTETDTNIKLQHLREFLIAEQIASEERNETTEEDEKNEDEESEEKKKENEKPKSELPVVDKTAETFSKNSTLSSREIESKAILNKSKQIDISPKPPTLPFKLKPINLGQQNPNEFTSRQKIALMLPRVTDYGKKKAFDDSRIISIPSLPASDGIMRLPTLTHMSSLSHRRTRLPSMVGMKFKNDAYKQ